MKLLFNECLDVYKFQYSTWEQPAFDCVQKIFDFSDQCGDEHLGIIVNNVFKYIENNKYLGSNYDFNVSNEVEFLKSIINYYLDNNIQMHDPAKMRGTSYTYNIDQSVQLHQSLFLLASLASIRLFNKLSEDPQYSKFLNLSLDSSEIANTVIRKQRDYGSQNVSKFGMWGLIVRVHDKIARLENLLSKKRNGINSVQNETVYDTLLDIIGYSTVSLLWINDWFLLPMGDAQ